ncbi:MAG: hypothetical protein D4R77_02945, partial [Planctomycetaceae bacterium]
MSLPSSNWATGAFQGAFQKTVTNVFYSRVLPTRRRRSRRPAQQISLESLEPRQMLSVNPASSGSSASSANDNSNIAAFVSQNTIGILSIVPSAPTAVVAVSGNASLAVTWTAPASNGGSAITDYLVKYSSNNGSTWTNFVHPVSPATSLTVTGLANGTAYVIKVIARNAVGISLPSANSAPATPAATVPGSPTAVAAVRGNASLAVTWTAPVSTGGSPITDYLVKYSSNNGSTWTNFVHPVSTVPSLSVTGLANGTNYVIKVIARNAVGISLPSANSAPVAPALLVMSRVTVGDAGNAADTNTGSLYGAVSYSYQIGAYDVTGSQYTAFLNAVGKTDTYALYNVNMGTNTTVAQISQSGIAGTYTYAVMNSTGQRPVSYVSWFDSARFSNWMSNGQLNGAQTSTTTENGAYNVNGATSGNVVAANATNPNTGLAPTYRIPLENEWYKAAYYKGGSTNAGYWTYATQSNVAPGTTIGSSANQANYNGVIPIGHATDVGSFTGSGSFYGTFDQSG